MFIIFDLDDTLVDTSACITPVKLELALQRMQEEGLRLEDFEKSLEVLLQIDRRSESAKSALEEFFEINELDQSFLRIALQTVYHDFSEEIPVFPIENALDLISDLSYEHKMAVVSVGNPEHQAWKMKKAGIDSSFFYKILFLEDKNKKKIYESLIKEMNVPAENVLVCGDRASVDLVPAKQLGCKTIHVRKGRGAYCLDPSSYDADFNVTDLLQIKKIVSDLSLKTSFD